MARLTWTEPALRDLESVAEYIALDKPNAARKLVQRVFARIDMLARHPELGSSVPELRPGTRYRQLVETPCRVFYRHERASGRVFILGVMRGEKLFQKRLLRERDKKSGTD